jgi:hypothetical protein
VICSLTMIVMALLYVYLPGKGKPVKIMAWEWVLVLTGSAIILFTFIWDYFKLVSRTGILSHGDNPVMKENFWKAITSFVPDHYNWWLFVAGELLILISVFLVVRKATVRN